MIIWQNTGTQYENGIEHNLVICVQMSNEFVFKWNLGYFKPIFIPFKSGFNTNLSVDMAMQGIY